MVTVYSTPTCAFCHALKEYLHDKKVKFAEKDLTKDAEAQKWVLEHTGQLAVPVSDIDGSVVIGFDRHTIETLLKEKKLLK
jgi:glutaredoxin-like YruB-family protein